MAYGIALICALLVNRNPQSLELKAAHRFLSEFADSAVQQPKPRTRKPKAAPQVEEEHPFLGPLSHHSV